MRVHSHPHCEFAHATAGLTRAGRGRKTGCSRVPRILGRHYPKKPACKAVGLRAAKQLPPPLSAPVFAAMSTASGATAAHLDTDLTGARDKPALGRAVLSSNGVTERHAPAPVPADEERGDTAPLVSSKDVPKPASTNYVVMAWIVSSVLSSTFLILVNKIIMRTYRFTFVYSLTTLHFFAGSVALSIAASGCKSFTPKSIGLSQNLVVAASAVGSVASMNLSLQYNSVGTYQMLKLLTIPGCMVAQYFMQGSRFSTQVMLSLAVMILGVALATVTDITFSYLGLTIGMISVVTTTQFAIWQGSKQAEHKVDAQQLLHSISPYQTLCACVLALLFDCQGEENIFNHNYMPMEVVLIVLSALIAVAVNMSAMTLIGKTSAVTYQVVGHAKTCLILIAGYLFIPDSAQGWEFVKNISGVAVGLLGVFAYSYYKLKLGR